MQQQQATGVSAVEPSRTVVGTGDGVVGAQAHGVEILHQDLQPSPAAPVVEPMGHHGRSEEILLEDEEDSGAPAAPPIASVPADGQQQHASDGAAVERRAGSVEMVGSVETGGEQLALPQASDGAAVVLRVERRSSGREILSDEEEGSSQATAAPPTADRRQETAVESDGGLSSSTNLRAATSEHNWFAILCALPHPTCAKWLYAVIFVAGIVLAMNSRDTEVSAFSDQERVHGCEHDRYCLGAESALRVSLAFFVSARNISIILLVLRIN
jgi:hypothetical protein